MKRSTNSAPDSLSTSYLIGSEFIGISMTTLKESGMFLPGETLSRDMFACRWSVEKRKPGRRTPLECGPGTNPQFTFRTVAGRPDDEFCL